MQQSILFVTLMVSISTSLLAVQAGGSSSMPMTVEEITTYTKKENLNGQEFVYSQQVINGKATKGWTIDGRPVTY
ncbi:MAG TPA: hypothetical protein VLG71_02455, partial [Candidatus Limnocylindria bacterium]|nr:hypothetical protein [Candidatus Limnocylindria bacterium]